LTYSEQFDNAAWGVPTNVIPNAIISPDGTQNADNLIGLLARNVSLSNTTYTLSFYAKKNTSSTFQMRVDIGGIKRATYNFDTQTSVNDGISSSITPFGNGWFLCTFTFASPLSGTAAFYPNEASSNLYMWGMQLEAGSYATSYIPTTSASVTRNADVISKTGISSLIGQTEGTLFAEIITIKGDSNWFEISNGTSENWIFIGKDGNQIRAYFRANNNLILDNNSFTITDNIPIKIAFAYKSGNYSLYINGNLIVNGTNSFSFSSALTRADIALLTGVVNGSNNYNSMALWKTALTNTQLAQLTTI
jgi:hypothetical protein